MPPIHHCRAHHNKVEPCRIGALSNGCCEVKLDQKTGEWYGTHICIDSLNGDMRTWEERAKSDRTRFYITGS